MEFYEFGEMPSFKKSQPKPDIVTYTSNKSQLKPDTITYKNNPTNLSNGSNEDPLKPLYKGSCKTKNLFSCCDQPVRENEY